MRGLLRLRFRLALVVLGSALGGCSSSTSAKGIVGNYQVMISYRGVSDPDVMTIKQGASSTVLVTFTAGITTTPMSPDADGLRATLSSATQFKLVPQPAHVDHSTGNLDGNLSGEGTVPADGTVMATLHFTPTGGVVRDADGGLLPVPDGGSGVTLDYEVTGSRQ